MKDIKKQFYGLTVLELARIIDMYILPNKDIKGIIHLSAEQYPNMICRTNCESIQQTIKIKPNKEIKIDRSLNSEYFKKLTGYKSDPWPLLINSMKEFNLLNQ